MSAQYPYNCSMSSNNILAPIFCKSLSNSFCQTPRLCRQVVLTILLTIFGSILAPNNRDIYRKLPGNSCKTPVYHLALTEEQEQLRSIQGLKYYREQGCVHTGGKWTSGSGEKVGGMDVGGGREFPLPQGRGNDVGVGGMRFGFTRTEISDRAEGASRLCLVPIAVHL